MSSFAMVGTVVDADDDWKLRIFEDCLVVVDDNGMIVEKCQNSREHLESAQER